MLGLLLALRQLRARPTAALVTLLGVAIGVAGVRAMALGSEGALRTLRHTWEDAAGPATWTALPPDPRGTLPAEAVAALTKAPGVTGTFPLLTTATVRIEEVRQWFGVMLPEGDAALLLVGAEEPQWRPEERPSCGDPCTLAGSTVLVGETWARSRGLKAGDPLHLAVAGKVVQVSIGGTVERWGLGGRGFGRVVIAPLAAVRQALDLPSDAVGELGLVTDRPPPETPGVVLVRPGDRGADVEQRLANVRAGTDLLSGVTLLLAGLLVAGQAATRATERQRLLGLLRAVGATRGQVVAALLVEVIAVAIPGALLGVALGQPLASAVAFALGQAAQADLRVGDPDLGGALTAAMAGILTATFAALLPAWTAAGRPPLNSLRARSGAAAPPRLALSVVALVVAAGIGASFLVWPPGAVAREVTLARVVALVLAVSLALPGLLPRLSHVATARPAVTLGLAALRWRPLRSGLAAATVLVCVALVGGVGALGHGVRAELDRWSDRALAYDLYASRPDGFSSGEIEALRALPGVTALAPVSIVPATVRVERHEDGRGAALALVGVEPAAWAPLLEAVDGSVATLAPDEAFVPAVVAAQLDVHVGDTLVAGERRFRVRATVVDYTQNGFGVLVSRGALGDPPADVVAVRGDAKAAFEALPGVTVESRGELRGRILRLVDQSMAALDVLSWLGGAIGVLAVAAALGQAAVERRADVAILRAVGLERRDVARMMVTEAVATALVGVIPGIPLGIVLGRIFAGATATLGLPIPYVPAWSAIFGASLVAVFAAAAAAWVPARALAGVSPREALRE